MENRPTITKLPPEVEPIKLTAKPKYADWHSIPWDFLDLQEIEPLQAPEPHPS